ncbi:RNA recognition motif-containing protein, partial [Irineochytrium annulatum]
KKLGNLEDIIFPVPSSPTSAHVLYATPTDASYAVTKLNKHVFKGVTLTSTLLTPDPRHAQLEASRAARRSRLIVRNLPFGCDEAQVRKAFEPHGDVVEVTMPVGPAGKRRGFAFVQMGTLEEAEKAMTEVNGKEVQGREVAVDWSVAKAVWDRRKGDDADEEDGKKAKAQEAEGAKDAEEGEEADGDDEEDGEAAAGDDDKEVEKVEDDSDAEAEEDDGYGVVEDDDDEDEDDGVEIIMDDEVDIEEETPKASKPKTKKGPMDDSNNATIFVRNLLFESTEEELEEKFATFGPLEYALITRDPATNRSRGTAFVRFTDPSHADACMKAYRIAEKAANLLMDTDEPAPDSKDKKKPKKPANEVPFKSVMTMEPSQSSTETQPFILGGRFLNLNLAVPKKDATRLAEESALERRKADKRNMHLLPEGLIRPNTPEARALTEPELVRRQKGYQERKRLLGSNPSLYVSRHRLSVRGLNNKVEDAALKRAAVLAVKRFWDEVEAGKRKGLEEVVVEEELEEGRERPSGERRIKVKQAKIMRDKERIDPTTQKGRSKGFGFVEFDSHADALCCLRWMNASPYAFGADGRALGGEEVKKLRDGDEQPEKGAKRPIVEFAIENKVVIRRREAGMQAQREKREKVEEEEAPAKEGRKERTEKKDGGEVNGKVGTGVKPERKGKAAEIVAKGGKRDDRKAPKRDDKKPPKNDGDNAAAVENPNAAKKKRKQADDSGASPKKRKQADEAGDDDGIVVEGAAAKKKKAKKSRPLTKAEQRNDKEEADFSQLLKKYGKGLMTK